MWANGPNLGRPYADHITGSRHHNMKELRTKRGQAHFRILFIFDPQRMALLLTGGNKAGKWTAWYRDAIARADDLYDAHLKDLDSS